MVSEAASTSGWPTKTAELSTSWAPVSCAAAATNVPGVCQAREESAAHLARVAMMCRQRASAMTGAVCVAGRFWGELDRAGWGAEVAPCGWTGSAAGPGVEESGSRGAEGGERKGIGSELRRE